MSKLTNTKTAGYNCTMIQKILVAPSIEAIEAYALKVTPNTGYMVSIASTRRVRSKEDL